MAACSRSVRRASPERRQARHSSAPIIDIAPTPSGGGYWLAGTDGSVLGFGDAGSFGSLAGGPVPNPVVALTAAPDGGGYWMLTAEGGVFTFGSAGFFGSLPGAGVKARAVDLLARPQGDGYWIVDDRGGVHPFGAAPGVGSLPTVNVQPAGKVVGGAVSPTGAGYWIASLAGGVYAFGDATSYPVAPLPAGQHVVGIAAAPAGAGYWVAASDGFVPALPGDQGDHVRAIQDRLTKLGYWMGPIDGRTGSLMSQAVMAFQKYMGLPRTGIADQPTVDALTVAVTPVARTTSGNIVEIDKGRQIIFVVRDGKTVAVFNSSTGSNVPFRERVAGGRIATGNAVTPVGRFTIDPRASERLAHLRSRSALAAEVLHVHGHRGPRSNLCARISGVARVRTCLCSRDELHLGREPDAQRHRGLGLLTVSASGARCTPYRPTSGARPRAAR